MFAHGPCRQYHTTKAYNNNNNNKKEEMAKAAILEVLESTIGRYVLNLDAESLNVAVWSGKIELQKLQLDIHAINSELSRKAHEAPNLACPFRVTSGSTFDKVSLDVPWARLSSRPVVFRAKGLYVYMEPHDFLKEDMNVENRWGTKVGVVKRKKHSEKDGGDKLLEERRNNIHRAEVGRQRVRAVSMAWEEDDDSESVETTTDDNNESSSSSSSSTSSSFTSRLVRRIIENLQVEIEDVHIAIRGCGCAAGIVLGSLSLVTTDMKGNRTFVDRKTKNVKDPSSSFWPTGKKPDPFLHMVYLNSIKDLTERKIASKKHQKQYYPEDWKDSQAKKLEKNNGIETDHKNDKKEEWDGKFSSSTIEDEVKDDKDDKAVSEEEPLDELTEGKLEEIEKLKSTFKEPTKKNPYDKPYTNFKKLSQRQIVQDFLDNPDMNTFQTEHVPKEAKKSWEAWLEKDALDGKGGNEAKDDLMMPSLMGMYKKPTKQTKEGQARDYIRDTPHVESYHSRRLGHGKKYESGRRPLEKKPQSGGFVNEPRKEEWDITADQDAQQRGSGKNTFDDKDDVEPAGGFIQGQGRTIPKTGKSPKIKPQGKGVKHKGRPRGSKNKTWESWLNKYEETVEDKRLAVKLDEARAIASGKVSKPKIKPDAGVDAEMGEFSNIQAEKLRSATVSPLDSWATWLEKMQGAGDARFGNQHLTGLDQKPVNNEEDEANILPAKDENQEENDEKQEETEDKEGKDNKPYKALSQE